MKTFLFIGTTAELIKLAPVIKELNQRKKEFTIITTGQNDIHFEEFKSMIGSVRIVSAVTPKSVESSIVKFFIWTVRTFFSLLLGMRHEFRGLNKNNSFFIVHGDTVSSLMGSLVAFFYGLRLVHIESGLRSFNVLEPFPEEICRSIISYIATIHFCPNEWSLNNLKKLSGKKINTKQNTLYDVYRSAIQKKSIHPFFKQIKNKGKPYFIMVIHRQEHVMFGTEKTFEILKFIFQNLPKNMFCVFLVHDLSAQFIQSLEPIIPLEIKKNLIKTSRMPYGDFVHVLNKAEFFITDGGSNQEESYYMGKPCLLIRNYTERIEGLGENVVLSRGKSEVIKQFIDHYKEYKRKPLQLKFSPSKIIVDGL